MKPLVKYLENEKALSQIKNLIFGYNFQRNNNQVLECKSIFERILSTSGSSKLCLDVVDGNGREVYVNLYSLIWNKYDLFRREEILRMVS